MTMIALVATYEPNARLIEVLDDLGAAGFERVVVNDGSGPDYREIFDRVPDGVTVLRHPLNEGKGAAIKTGLSFIQNHYQADTVIVCVDGDGQHSAHDALACAIRARENPEALVLGCRDFDAPSVPRRSRWGNKFTRSALGIIGGVRVSDTQTGLRAFSAELIGLLLATEGERYEYETEMLIMARNAHVELVEVPIATVYENENAGSHYRTIVDSLRIFIGVFKFAGASFASFLVDYALYALLMAMTFSAGAIGIAVSNVVARVISAVFNYNLNRNLVFHDSQSVARTAPRYFALALGILVGNTAAIEFFVGVLGLNGLLAKIIVELGFFVVSWTVQRFAIFAGAKSRPSDRQALRQSQAQVIPIANQAFTRQAKERFEKEVIVEQAHFG